MGTELVYKEEPQAGGILYIFGTPGPGNGFAPGARVLMMAITGARVEQVQNE